MMFWSGRIMSMRGSAAGATFAAVMLVGACGGSEAPAATAEEPAAVVLAPEDVAEVRVDSIGAGTVLTGSLEPWRRVEVRAQVPGVVMDLRVDRGDAVRAGQVLARIEAEGIRGQAEGARAAVAAAEANLALARRQYESARTLHEAGAMSDIEFQQTQAAWEAAQAQLTAARAQAAGAEEAARRATVTAPIDGEISRRDVSEGEAVSVGASLLTVVNSDWLELQGQVPVNQATRIRAGMPVEFTIDAFPGSTFTGEVARVEPVADPATRQVGVYVRLSNRDRGLLGGLFATGRILTGEVERSLIVPVQALRGNGNGTWVWAVRDDTIVRVPVRAGARDEGRAVVAVVGDLTEGDRVIVGPGEIEEGAVVRIASSALAEGQ